jgi:ribosomal protein S6--L-glutamate ligase
MRIAFLLRHHPPSRPSPIFPEVIRQLRRRGAVVDVVYPESDLTSLAGLRVAHDLYVLKSGTETALSLAGALHTLGATILNPFPVSVMCRDKIVASKVLAEAGVPAPHSYVAEDEKRFAALLEEGPLVVKPHRGSGGRGVLVVRRRSELKNLQLHGQPLFAQRYHESDGVDRKIYCIGENLFGVERVWPPLTYEEKVGRPFYIGDDLREIAVRCGAAFGMSLFGFDVIMSAGHPYVVDISSFPGFKGVPDAAGLLSDYIHAAAKRIVMGEPLLAGLVGNEWVRP